MTSGNAVQCGKNCIVLIFLAGQITNHVFCLGVPNILDVTAFLNILYFNYWSEITLRVQSTHQTDTEVEGVISHFAKLFATIYWPYYECYSNSPHYCINFQNTLIETWWISNFVNSMRGGKTEHLQAQTYLLDALHCWLCENWNAHKLSARSLLAKSLSLPRLQNKQQVFTHSTISKCSGSRKRKAAGANIFERCVLASVGQKDWHSPVVTACIRFCLPAMGIFNGKWQSKKKIPQLQTRWWRAETTNEWAATLC